MVVILAFEDCACEVFFVLSSALVVASVRRCAGRTFRGGWGRVMVVILAFEDSLAGVFRSKFGLVVAGVRRCAGKKLLWSCARIGAGFILEEVL